MDRFEKAEKNGTSVWVVDEVINVPDMPPHVRLIRQWSGATEFRTVAVAALFDETIYRPLPPLLSGEDAPREQN
nr:hypothetical protein [Phaeovibrio sulfidiphilus]